eukprot:CFRG0122T1
MYSNQHNQGWGNPPGQQGSMYQQQGIYGNAQGNSDGYQSPIHNLGGGATAGGMGGGDMYGGGSAGMFGGNGVHGSNASGAFSGGTAGQQPPGAHSSSFTPPPPHQQQQQQQRQHQQSQNVPPNGPGFDQMAQFVTNPMFSSMAANVTDWDQKKADVRLVWDVVDVPNSGFCIVNSQTSAEDVLNSSCYLVERNVSKLKFYFQVSNSYVMNKMRLILFPWLHKDWSRRVSYEGSDKRYLCPREDINAPDLYIPAMSYVTFVVVTGIFYGHQGTFQPERLGIVASSMLVWLVIEVGIVWFGFYLLNVSAPYSFLDLVAYCGYKYSAMILALVAFMFGGQMPYYCVMGYTSLSMAVFLLRTLRSLLTPAVPDSMHTNTHQRSTNTFVLVKSDNMRIAGGGVASTNPSNPLHQIASVVDKILKLLKSIGLALVSSR